MEFSLVPILYSWSLLKKNLTHKGFIYSNDILKELDFRFINCFYIKNI